MLKLITETFHRLFEQSNGSADRKADCRLENFADNKKIGEFREKRLALAFEEIIGERKNVGLWS